MLSSYTTLSKRREQDLNLRRILTTRFLLAGGRFQPLSHLSTVGRAGFEPACKKEQFYRLSPSTRLGHRPKMIPLTGLEPAISALKEQRLNHSSTGA
jgi:hypothetical protein